MVLQKIAEIDNYVTVFSDADLTEVCRYVAAEIEVVRRFSSLPKHPHVNLHILSKEENIEPTVKRATEEMGYTVTPQHISSHYAISVYDVNDPVKSIFQIFDFSLTKFDLTYDTIISNLEHEHSHPLALSPSVQKNIRNRLCITRILGKELPDEQYLTDYVAGYTLNLLSIYPAELLVQEFAVEHGHKQSHYKSAVQRFDTTKKVEEKLGSAFQDDNTSRRIAKAFCFFNYLGGLCNFGLPLLRHYRECSSDLQEKMDSILLQQADDFFTPPILARMKEDFFDVYSLFKRTMTIDQIREVQDDVSLVLSSILAQLSLPVSIETGVI